MRFRIVTAFSVSTGDVVYRIENVVWQPFSAQLFKTLDEAVSYLNTWKEQESHNSRVVYEER